MLLHKVQKQIREQNMIEPKDRIIVGLSGGADSVCLFLVLCTLRDEMQFSVETVHVEHGIRGEESRQDAFFAETLSRQWNVPHRTIAISVPEYASEHGLGFEEAARILRYEIFEQVAKERNAKIALAHHMEDNAETILFQLARGSSLTGLCGMRPVRKSESGTIYIRPLLSLHRNEIESYLDVQKQAYCTDCTNMENEYSRNYLRNVILPEFRNINLQTVAHINETAERLNEVRGFLEEEVERHWNEAAIVGDGIFLDLEKLNRLHIAVQREIYYKAIARMAGGKKDISSVHVEQLMALSKKQSGKEVTLPNDVIAVKEYEMIRLFLRNVYERNIYERNAYERNAYERNLYQRKVEKKSVGNKDVAECGTICAKNQQMEVTAEMLERLYLENERLSIPFLDGKTQIQIAVFENNIFMDEIPRKTYTKWFDYDKIKGGFCIRRRQSGDYLIYDASGHRKKLKQYFVDEKIPVTKRDKIWILAQEHLVLWVVGGRISEHLKVTGHTKSIVEITIQEET